MGWQVEAGVQSSKGRPRLLNMYKIGCVDFNGAIDECGFSWRARAKSVWALIIGIHLHWPETPDEA